MFIYFTVYLSKKGCLYPIFKFWKGRTFKFATGAIFHRYAAGTDNGNL